MIVFEEAKERERLVLARDMQRGNKRSWTKGSIQRWPPYQSSRRPSQARLNRGQSRSKSGETKEEEGVENRLANREALIQPRFPAKRQSGTNPRSPRAVPSRPRPPGPFFLSGIPLSIGIYPLNSHLSKPNAGHFRPSDRVSSSASAKFL